MSEQPEVPKDSPIIEDVEMNEDPAGHEVEVEVDQTGDSAAPDINP